MIETTKYLIIDEELMNLTGRHNNNIEWSGRKVWSLTLHQAAPPTDFYLLQDVFTIFETKE